MVSHYRALIISVQSSRLAMHSGNEESGELARDKSIYENAFCTLVGILVSFAKSTKDVFMAATKDLFHYTRDTIKGCIEVLSGENIPKGAFDVVVSSVRLT